MNKNGNTYAIGALKRRRAEIDGEVQECEKRLRNLNEALCRLDASIALLDPTYDPASVRPKRPYRHAKLFGGRKLTGLILDALRSAELPLTTQEVVSAITDEMNGGGGAPNVARRISMGLQYLARRGSLRWKQLNSSGLMPLNQRHFLGRMTRWL